VIHAKNGIEFTFGRSMENRIGRKRTFYYGLRIADCGLKLSNGRRDDFDFFTPNFPRFAGVWI